MVSLTFPYGFKRIVLSQTSPAYAIGFVDAQNSTNKFFDSRNSSVAVTTVGFPYYPNSAVTSITVAATAGLAQTVTISNLYNETLGPYTIGQYSVGGVVPCINTSGSDYSITQSNNSQGQGITSFSVVADATHIAISSVMSGVLLNNNTTTDTGTGTETGVPGYDYGLSTPIIVGIVLACIVGAALIGFGIYKVVQIHHLKQASHTHMNNTNANEGQALPGEVDIFAPHHGYDESPFA